MPDEDQNISENEEVSPSGDGVSQAGLQPEAADFADFMQANQTEMQAEPAEAGKDEIIETSSVPADGKSDESDDMGLDDSAGPSVLSELKGVISELNISFGQVVGFIAILLVVGAVVIGSFYFLFGSLGDIRGINRQEVAKESREFFLTRWWNNVFDGSSKVDNKTETKSEDKEVEKDADPSIVVKPETEKALNDLRNIGRETALPSTETADRTSDAELDSNQFAFNVYLVLANLGQDVEVNERLSYYVRTYRRIRNTFNTDLFSYLDAQIDRQKSYNQFVSDFKSYLATGKLVLEDLRQEVGALNETLARIDEAAESAESNYSAAAENYQSEKLPSLLDTFQDLSAQRAVVLAELRSREQILEKFEDAIPIVEEKIIAIEANQDAFVRAVRVIDFKQVDLDLIVDQQ